MTAPGLWTTPVRGRVAVAALAWVLAYVGGVVVVILGGLAAMSSLGVQRPSTAVLALAVLGGTATAALVAVRVHLLRRRGLTWADLGLRRPDRSPAHLLWQIPTVLFAAAAVSALAFVVTGVGAQDEGGDEVVVDLATGGPVLGGLGLLAVAGLVPLFEEVVFRGILLPAVRARLRVVPGVVLAGVVFALVHLLPPAMPYLVVVGIALCAMAEWYRSIVPGIVLHGVNNAIVFALVLSTL